MKNILGFLICFFFISFSIASSEQENYLCDDVWLLIIQCLPKNQNKCLRLCKQLDRLFKLGTRYLKIDFGYLRLHTNQEKFLGYQNLRKLSLSKDNLCECANFQFLKNFSSLKEFSFGTSTKRIRPKNLQYIKDLTNLETLEIYYAYYDDCRNIACFLTNLTNLKKLSLDTTWRNFIASDLLLLTILTNLRSLKLHNYGTKEEYDALAKKLTNVQFLSD